MAAPAMRPFFKRVRLVATIGVACLFLVYWLRSSALSISSFPKIGQAKQIASGLFWRQWHIGLDNQKAAEQLIKEYNAWVDSKHWRQKTNPKYGVSRQWTTFIDATRTPPVYITQWGDVAEDRRGWRLLSVCVRNEHIFDDNGAELGPSKYPDGKYDFYITLELNHWPF